LGSALVISLGLGRHFIIKLFSSHLQSLSLVITNLETWKLANEGAKTNKLVVRIENHIKKV